MLGENPVRTKRFSPRAECPGTHAPPAVANTKLTLAGNAFDNLPSEWVARSTHEVRPANGNTVGLGLGLCEHSLDRDKVRSRPFGSCPTEWR